MANELLITIMEHFGVLEISLSKFIFEEQTPIQKVKKCSLAEKATQPHEKSVYLSNEKKITIIGRKM